MPILLAASGSVPVASMGSRKLARRNSTLYVQRVIVTCVHPLITFCCFCRQLQPLVARIQCGDLQFVLRNILEDRRDQGKVQNAEGSPVMETSLSVPLLHRSCYRQLLFLKLSLYPDTFDIGIIQHAGTIIFHM